MQELRAKKNLVEVVDLKRVCHNPKTVYLQMHYGAQRGSYQEIEDSDLMVVTSFDR